MSDLKTLKEIKGFDYDEFTTYDFPKLLDSKDLQKEAKNWVEAERELCVLAGCLKGLCIHRNKIYAFNEFFNLGDEE